MNLFSIAIAVASALVAGAPALLQASAFSGGRLVQPQELQGFLIAMPIIGVLAWLAACKRACEHRQAKATIGIALLLMGIATAIHLMTPPNFPASVVDGLGLIVAAAVSYATASLALRTVAPNSKLRDSRLKRGLTLVEVLIVILIVALLVGLLVPTYRYAIRQANAADSSARLRQLHLAISMYQEAHDQRMPNGLDPLVESKYVLASLLKNPWDPFPEGFGTREVQCIYRSGQYRREVHSSFDDILIPGTDLFATLEKIDPNHGIVADRTVGRFNGMRAGCYVDLPHAFDGPLLRLRKDGSVQRARYWSRGLAIWERLRLYTDEALPRQN